MWGIAIENEQVSTYWVREQKKAAALRDNIMTFGDSGMILHFVTVIVTEIYTQVRHTKLYMMSQDFKSSSFLFSIFTYYFKFSYKYTMYLGHIYPHSFLSTSLRLPLTHIPPNFMSSLYLCNSLSPSSVVHMHTDVGSYT